MTTKYEKVKTNIRELIKSGQYEVGKQLPTESDLMKKYQVSRYTIRRAMGELENEHYIYRIQGGGMYVDNWQEAQNQKPNNKVIGVITTHLADYIFPSIISGIDRAIASSGYSILLSNTHNDQKQERQSLNQMINSDIDGLIIEPTQSALPNPNNDLYVKLRNSKFPTIFINAHYDNSSFPYLDVADRETEHKLINTLFDAGHRRILGVFKVDDMQGVDRMRGYLDAYTDHPKSLLQSDLVMYQSSDDVTNIFAQIARRLQVDQRPTAIACYNDQLTIQVMDVVRSIGLHIPTDVSIVGFDDYQLSAYVLPGLTTAAHPKNKMGMDAGTMILQRIAGKKVDPIIYHPKIIMRKSVRKITSGKE